MGDDYEGGTDKRVDENSLVTIARTGAFSHPRIDGAQRHERAPTPAVSRTRTHHFRATMRAMRTNRIIHLAYAAVAVAAPVLAGCGPSVDPALKADIDRRIASLAKPTQTFPGPTAFQPQPFQVGQWTQHKMVYDQQPSFLTTKVVGQDGDAFWIESLQESYSGRTVTKILLSIPNRMDPASIEIRGVVMKDRNGHVQTIDGPVLSMMQGLYRRRGREPGRELAGSAAGGRVGARGQLRRLLQDAHRRAVGRLEVGVDVLVAPGGAALGHGAQRGHRQAEQHGAGRVRTVGRGERISSSLAPGAALSRAVSACGRSARAKRPSPQAMSPNITIVVQRLVGWK